jgi:hypothetical protein
MKTTAYRQSGLSLTGLLIGAVVIGFAALIGMKLIPAYMQDAEIKNIFDAVAYDPEMQKAPAKDVRQGYHKRALVANINVIKAEDVEIEKDGDRILLSARYEVRVPLAGNVSLLLEFNPSSSR